MINQRAGKPKYYNKKTTTFLFSSFMNELM